MSNNNCENVYLQDIAVITNWQIKNKKTMELKFALRTQILILAKWE